MLFNCRAEGHTSLKKGAGRLSADDSRQDTEFIWKNFDRLD